VYYEKKSFVVTISDTVLCGQKIVVLYAIIVMDECEITIRSACHFLAI